MGPTDAFAHLDTVCRMTSVKVGRWAMFGSGWFWSLHCNYQANRCLHLHTLSEAYPRAVDMISSLILQTWEQLILCPFVMKLFCPVHVAGHIIFFHMKFYKAYKILISELYTFKWQLFASNLKSTDYNCVKIIKLSHSRLDEYGYMICVFNYWVKTIG